MTTVTFKEDLKIKENSVISVDDFLKELLLHDTTSIEEEPFSLEEKIMIKNRSSSVKKIESDINSLLA